MSRSNSTELINPATRHFEWQGSTGKIKYFDKNIGEKGENVFVKLPFHFLVLDQLSTIKGFSDADQSGFWSNEIRNTKTEPFTVKTKKGTVATGLYESLAKVLNEGAKYSKSVYIAYFDDNKELCIGNIQMYGSAIGAWIELCKGKDIYKYAISITGGAAMKKGKTDYFVPVFKLNPDVKPETEAKAVELDKILQEYLNGYFNRKPQEETPEDVVTPKQKEAIKEMEPEFKDARGNWQARDKADKAPIPGEMDDPSDDLPF